MNEEDIPRSDLVKLLEGYSQRLEGIKALWGNGIWSEDEAYDSVYQFKEWTVNEILKLLGFTVVTRRRITSDIEEG